MAIMKGISFPFRFNSKGGVTTSQLQPDDYSRIFESIYQIILTRKNERIMLNDFGTDATQALFFPTDDLTELGILRFEIEKALEEQEERITINDITATPTFFEDSRETKIVVVIDAYIVKFMTDATFSLEIPVDTEEMGG
jgi:phage baseplate assembly protein W